MTMAPRAPVVHLVSVDSTQRVAFALAAQGTPDGTVVIADVQDAGRGRRGRTWMAEPGESLLASIVCRPRLSPAAWPLLSLATAVAVAETLAELGVSPRVKWPNDVLARERKIAGILLESRIESEPVVAVGIGINVHQRAFPPDLGDRATSVWRETGRAPAVPVVLESLVVCFGAWRARLEGEGFTPVRERWRALSATLGAHVSVDGTNGVARDLDDDGALLVEDAGGLKRIVAGEVEHAARR